MSLLSKDTYPLLFVTWKQLKQIYENFATYVHFDEFMKVYEYAVSKPQGFLFIDTDPKDPSMRFRSGFNEFIGGSKK